MVAFRHRSGPSRPSSPPFTKTSGPCSAAARPIRRVAIWKTSSPQRSASSTSRRRSGSAGKRGGSGRIRSRKRAISRFDLTRSPSRRRVGTVPIRSAVPSMRLDRPSSSPKRSWIAGKAAQPQREGVQARGQLDRLVLDALVVQHQHSRSTGVRAENHVELRFHRRSVSLPPSRSHVGAAPRV